jgi:hypothetical protein
MAIARRLPITAGKIQHRMERDGKGDQNPVPGMEHQSFSEKK